LEDTKAVQPLINQVVMYPLSQYDGKMKTKDYAKSPHFPVPAGMSKGEDKWVNPSTYFEELPVVMKEVPPLPGEEALYGWIRSVWGRRQKSGAQKSARGIVRGGASGAGEAAVPVPIRRPLDG
jgi:hypothetical protein